VASLIPNGGCDKYYTPARLAKKIVKYFNPKGIILEPCAGTGVFLKYMPDAEHCEIDEGIDYFDYNKKVDWIITNPPYSKFKDFLLKGLTHSKNIVFLSHINAFFFKARIRNILQNHWKIAEIILIDTPKKFPQGGLQMGIIHLKKNFKGDIKFTNWCNY
jgi:type I restriction-modification system DNA methylase subunit